MYCPTCGKEVASGCIFCAQCGTRLASESSKTSNDMEMVASEVNKFKKVRDEKERERRSSFKIKKRRVSVPHPVKISVARLDFEYGYLKRRRNTTNFVEVLTEDTYDDVLMKCVAKFKLLFADMADVPYVLVRSSFPGYKKVDVIPVMETESDVGYEPTIFTVKDYKALIGKPYQQILLFLVTEEEFLEFTHTIEKEAHSNSAPVEPSSSLDNLNEDLGLESTRLCTNCNREIAIHNFMLHESHCQRYLTVCQICLQSVPEAHMAMHMNSTHMIIACENCRQTMEIQYMENHLANFCSKRIISCSFCGIPLLADSMPEHTIFCGSRTEQCPRCYKYVTLQERNNHDSFACDSFARSRVLTSLPSTSTGSAIVSSCEGDTKMQALSNVSLDHELAVDNFLSPFPVTVACTLSTVSMSTSASSLIRSSLDSLDRMSMGQGQACDQGSAQVLTSSCRALTRASAINFLATVFPVSVACTVSNASTSASQSTAMTSRLAGDQVPLSTPRSAQVETLTYLSHSSASVLGEALVRSTSRPLSSVAQPHSMASATLVTAAEQTGSDHSALPIDVDSDNDLPDPHIESASENRNLAELVKGLAAIVDECGKKNIVNVDREDVLDGGFRAFSKKAFNPVRQLSVCFVGEDGIDRGGLSREFMGLAMKKIVALPIFGGNMRARSLVLNVSAKEKAYYMLVGKFIAYCLVHGGPVANFLHPELYKAISEGVDQAKPNSGDICDVELRAKLQKIESAQNVEEFFHSTNEMMQIIELAGCAHLVVKLENKQQLLDSVCHFLFVGHLGVVLKEFEDGLSDLEVLASIRRNPKAMKDAFVYSSNSKPLTMLVVKALFADVRWSPAGSNKYSSEKKTMTHWLDFLEDLEADTENNLLPSLLVFATGLDSIPPMGFTPQPSITFGHEDMFESGDYRKGLPFVSTCSLQLQLPVLADYDTFKERMLNCIVNATTFTSQ